MKTFIIQERFTGYNDVYIEANSKDEAISLYNRGQYKYSDVNQDDYVKSLLRNCFHYAIINQQIYLAHHLL